MLALNCRDGLTHGVAGSDYGPVSCLLLTVEMGSYPGWLEVIKVLCLCLLVEMGSHPGWLEVTIKVLCLPVEMGSHPGWLEVTKVLCL